MEYKEFTNSIAEMLEKRLDEEHAVIRQIAMPKINETVNGIAIEYPGEMARPLVYLDGAYQSYLRGEESLESIARGIEGRLGSIRYDTPEIPELSRQSAEKNLYCVLINAEMNKDLLRDVPYEMLEDLAIIPRYRVGEEGSFVVKKDLCKFLQMTPEEIMEHARYNMHRQEYLCQSMEDVMQDILQKMGITDNRINELVEMQDKDNYLYVISNRCREEGAVAIAVEGVLEDVREQIGEDYYILPSSRHEVIAIPESKVGDVQELQELVATINGTEVEMADRLSDHVYKYSSLTQQLTIADDLTLSEKPVMEKVMTPKRTH